MSARAQHTIKPFRRE